MNWQRFADALYKTGERLMADGNRRLDIKRGLMDRGIVLDDPAITADFTAGAICQGFAAAIKAGISDETPRIPEQG